MLSRPPSTLTPDGWRSPSCTSDDILILYFSGHGQLAGSSYYLLPVDADPNNLRASAIESEELRAAMSECAARGILVILDCCQGAGFAENASRLFTTIGVQDFRIILCASRAGQSSLEFNSFRGTIFSHHLTEVVSGRVSLGEHPGIVFFSDLFEYLTARLGEDLEALGYSPDIQEAVFAGTYAKDPRLFILRQVALATLDLESPKYSRKFVTFDKLSDKKITYLGYESGHRPALPNADRLPLIIREVATRHA